MDKEINSNNSCVSKKIVAIGGGENGRIKPDGTKIPYELEIQDREIIRLTGKEHPNFLFIGHSVLLENQEGYFQVMKEAYEKRYGCNCRDLKSDKLLDKEYVKEQIEWADIIYEGGGNTLDMIKLWKKTGFDEVLRKAWESGRVMCGVSAGANCCFKECSSDSLKIKFGDAQPLMGMECLGFVEGLFVPHCDAPGRRENVKELLKTSKQIGLSMSNCTALEIIDDKYRLITSDASYHNIEAYGLKSYWKNGKYIEKMIEISNEFRPIAELLSK